MSTFESPLLIKHHTQFTNIRFGHVEPIREVTNLRQSLNRILFKIADKLPKLQKNETYQIFQGYSGGDGDFYSLFYVPIWSFLYWVPKDSLHPFSPDFQPVARTAHAMSLFLHLWDDHLCDRQLKLDMLRLHIRTAAWQKYTSSCYKLCEMLDLPPQVVDEHCEQYLVSQCSSVAVNNLDDYCSCFSGEVAIWKLVPHIFDMRLTGIKTGPGLSFVIDLFATAWRLLDDIQDVDTDIVAGKQTAIWSELGEKGRHQWRECHSRSSRSGHLDAKTWGELCRTLQESQCLPKLLSKIDDMLTTAAQVAALNGWNGLAQELNQSRIIQ